jgi:hypothetical protein
MDGNGRIIADERSKGVPVALDRVAEALARAREFFAEKKAEDQRRIEALMSGAG